MIPEEPRQFMTVEKAFILKESMDAIDELVRENERNQTWLDNFLPKNDMELLNLMILVVKQLCYAGFPILALEVQQSTIEKILYHNQTVKRKNLERKSEEEQILVNGLLEELMKWYTQIARHQEYDTVQDPAYCDYLHLQFYGKTLPDELTHNKHGYLMRVNQAQDIPIVTTKLRNIFSIDMYNYNPNSNAKVLMKVM